MRGQWLLQSFPRETTMNSKRKASHLLLAGLLATQALPAAADAAGDWLAYRTENKLPIDPAPSAPHQVVNVGAPPAYAGEAMNFWLYYRRSNNLPVDPQPSAHGNGNGNGNGMASADGMAWTGEAANFWLYHKSGGKMPADFVPMPGGE